MIVDFHTHTFPQKIAAGALEHLRSKSHSMTFSDGTNEGLLSAMKRSGIDLSVVLPVATNPGQVSKVNDSAARVNEQFGEAGICSFGCMHPAFEDYYSELKRIRDLGMKGIKLHPVYQGEDIDSPAFLRILDRAAQLDLIVVTHAGMDIGFPGVVHCSPQMLRHAVKEVGPFRFVLAHMGGWHNWNEVAENLADTGVLLDTSFSTGTIHPLDDGYYQPEELPMMDEEQFMELYRAFGAERLVFGTDSPWSVPEESIAFIQELPVTEEEKQKIFSANARRLLGI